MLVGLALIVSFGFGCASPNVNPQVPKSGLGYVDFYALTTGDLCWEVRHSSKGTNDLSRVYTELTPVQGGFLRMAFKPGHHFFQITFLNEVVTKPAEVEVEVQAGKITPVAVTLTETGTGHIMTKSETLGGTAYGRYGRTTKIGSYESVMYSLSAAQAKPMDYKPKEETRYEQ
jgi:hypothetical protein